MNTLFGLIKRKMRHQSAPSTGYTFHATGLPSPGSAQYAFETGHALPVAGLLGMGTPCGSFRALSAPLVYVTPAIPYAGLGGIQQGQFATTPLVNNNLSPLD